MSAGEEIFVSYGPNYWCNARIPSYSTDDVPEWEWDLSSAVAVPRLLAPALPEPVDVPFAVVVSGVRPAGTTTSFVFQCRSTTVINFINQLMHAVSPTLPSDPRSRFPRIECTFPLLESRARRSVDFWRPSSSVLTKYSFGCHCPTVLRGRAL